MTTDHLKIPLHDAELIHCSINRSENSLEFIFRTVNDSTRVLRFDGVVCFRGEDFWMQNVISRVLRLSYGNIKNDQVAYWIKWASSFSDGSTWRKDADCLNLHDACLQGELELVVFEPSIGATVAVVCKKVYFE